MAYKNIKIKRLNEGFYEPGNSYFDTKGDYAGKLQSYSKPSKRHLRQLRNLSDAIQALQERGLSAKRIMHEVQATLGYGEGYDKGEYSNF